MISFRGGGSGFAISVASAAMLSVLTGCGLIGSSSAGSQHAADISNDGAGLLKIAEAARNAGDSEEAMRLYRVAASKVSDPANKSSALVGAADCEIDLGNMAAAQQDYRAAIEAAPNAGSAYLGLGRAFLIQQKPEEGVHYLDLALKKGTDSPGAWNDMGVAYDELRRHPEAQHYYRSGLAKYPSDRALRNNLALSLAMSGEFSEAENIMRALVTETGATARTRDNLALVLGLAGDDEGAREASRADLDNAALDNNSRYYEQVRSAVADTRPTGQIGTKPSAQSSAPAVTASSLPAVATGFSRAGPPPKVATSAAKHDHRVGTASPRHRRSKPRHATASRHNRVSAVHRSATAQARHVRENHRRTAHTQTLASSVR